MRFIKTLSISLLIIMLLSLSGVSRIAADSTFTYHVNAGDQQSYYISNYVFNGKSKEIFTYSWEDGTVGNITVQAGMTFSIIVCNVTTNPDSTQTLFTKISWYGQITVCAESYYPVQVTDNRSFYEDLVNTNSSMYNLAGNTFTVSTNMNFGYAVGIELISIDITSGWLIEISEHANYPNGTLAYDIHYLQTTATTTSDQNNSGNGKTITTSPGFEVVTILGIIFVVTLKFLNRRRKN